MALWPYVKANKRLSSLQQTQLQSDALRLIQGDRGVCVNGQEQKSATKNAAIASETHRPDKLGARCHFAPPHLACQMSKPCHRVEYKPDQPVQAFPEHYGR